MFLSALLTPQAHDTIFNIKRFIELDNEDQANLNISPRKTSESINCKTHSSYIFIKIKNYFKIICFRISLPLQPPRSHYKLVVKSLNFDVTLHPLIHLADLY